MPAWSKFFDRDKKVLVQAFTSPDPAQILCASHRQIERALASLARIARESCGDSLSDPRAFSAALRFVRLVAPEHSAAEEEAVFPRLHRSVPSGNKDVRRLIDNLEEEHGCADRAYQEVNRLGESWLAHGTLSPAHTSRLISMLEGLAGLYDRHIQLEETEVFPLLAETLESADLASLGEELERRHLTVEESFAK